jgi:hypothetical protein
MNNDITTWSGRSKLVQRTGKVLSSYRYPTKNIFRVSGSHQLLLLNYYPYIARFLAPHQREVDTPPLSLVRFRQCPTFIGCPEKKPANYYPYIARFIAPHQREVDTVTSAVIGPFPPVSTFYWMPEKIRQNEHSKGGFLKVFLFRASIVSE